MGSKLTGPHSMFLSPLKLVCVRAEYEYVDGDRNFSLATGGISRFEGAILLRFMPFHDGMFCCNSFFHFSIFFYSLSIINSRSRRNNDTLRFESEPIFEYPYEERLQSALLDEQAMIVNLLGTMANHLHPTNHPSWCITQGSWHGQTLILTLILRNTKIMQEYSIWIYAWLSWSHDPYLCLL